MLLAETIRVALAALRANKLRALLTMLGIVIGVGSVITMMALGRGAEKAVNDRIACSLSLFPGETISTSALIW